MKSNHLLSVIIPVFNESNRLDGIKKIFSFLNKQSFKKEVIFVNDGSTDDTLKKLKNYQKKYSFKIISYPKNQGKGYAIKQGILKSHGDYCLFFDIDLSTPIQELKLFLPFFFQYEVLIASRKTKRSKLVKRQPFVREFLGKGFTAISQTVLQVNVSDFTCGFKCFSKKSAKKIFSNLTINRWGFDAEILFLTKKYQFSLIEIPVSWSNDSQTKVKFPQDIIRSLSDLSKIRINHLKGKY